MVNKIELIKILEGIQKEIEQSDPGSPYFDVVGAHIESLYTQNYDFADASAILAVIIMECSSPKFQTGGFMI